jgi:RNA polymerase sigma factor (sigma-70 family)
MTKSAAAISGFSDADLVTASVAGNRDAFGEIVVRYQTLIASLAYSATGSLAQSEDLSQETFVTAWQQLARLREPEKLRAWLCGIVRNLQRRAYRDRQTEPVADAVPLEMAEAAISRESGPSQQLITREEEAILWRSLDRVPENYREPLILFYRNQQSIERVAEVLDLTEDVVRQRLSRGRKLLQDEVVAFVEVALRQSVPGPTFSTSVLAALPPGAGAAAGAVGTKAGGWLGWVTLPFIGLFASLLGSVELWRLGQTAKVRHFTARMLLAMWLDCAALWIALPMSQWLRGRNGWSDEVFVRVQVGTYWIWAAVMAALLIRFLRVYRAFLPAFDQETKMPPPPLSRPALAVSLAMTVGSLAWLVQLSWLVRDFVSLALAMATGLVVVVWVTWLPAVLVRRGLAPSRFAWVPAALITGTSLLIVNLRIDWWLAAVRGTDLAGAHRFLPLAIVHGSTLFLVFWIAGVATFLKAPSPRLISP